MKRDNTYLIGNKFAMGNKVNSGAFKDGHEPWNKNKKGLHLSIKTEFKKGQKPKNYLSVGSLTIRIDKNGKLRQWIKIEEPNIWIEFSKFIWIKNNGKIPKGYLIHHIDLNSINDNINNLSLLTRKAHFEIHKIGEIGRMEISKRRTSKIQKQLFV